MAWVGQNMAVAIQLVGLVVHIEVIVILLLVGLAESKAVIAVVVVIMRVESEENLNCLA